jgi:hypothetical protein
MPQGRKGLAACFRIVAAEVTKLKFASDDHAPPLDQSLVEAKAPSPLRSAGALHRVGDVLECGGKRSATPL